MICCRAPPPRGPYDPRLPRVEPGFGPGLEAVDGVVVADEVVGVVPGFLSESGSDLTAVTTVGEAELVD